MSRKEQCIEALRNLGEATARQVAEYLYQMGYTPVLERNIAHPRLNELAHEGVVIIIGEVFDELTERYVSVYRLI